MARRDEDVVVIDSDDDAASAKPPEDDDTKRRRQLAEAEARRANAVSRKRRVSFSLPKLSRDDFCFIHTKPTAALTAGGVTAARGIIP
jgi:hypothetical protein